jgi:Restriction endonuclease
MVGVWGRGNPIIGTAPFAVLWGNADPGKPAPQIVLSSAVISLADELPDDRQLELSVLGFSWDALKHKLEADPEFLYRELTSRQLEILLAEAYEARGYEVELTPEKKDGGRDVIAIDKTMGIRIIDEVKSYRPDYKVGVDVVHKLHSVLELEQNVSKGFVSTTSDFTSGVFKRFGNLIPSRLDLRNGEQLSAFIRASAISG